MNKREITKIVVRNLNGLSVAGVTTSIIKSNSSVSSNSIVNAVYFASAFVASYCVSGTVCEPVNAYADRQVDNFYDFFDGFKK